MLRTKNVKERTPPQIKQFPKRTSQVQEGGFPPFESPPLHTSFLPFPRESTGGLEIPVWRFRATFPAIDSGEINKLQNKPSHRKRKSFLSIVWTTDRKIHFFFVAVCSGSSRLVAVPWTATKVANRLQIPHFILKKNIYIYINDCNKNNRINFIYSQRQWRTNGEKSQRKQPENKY